MSRLLKLTQSRVHYNFKSLYRSSLIEKYFQFKTFQPSIFLPPKNLVPALSTSSSSDGSNSNYGPLAAIATSILIYLGGGFYSEKAHACGIMAVAGEENVVPYLLEGLIILQNHGYDSAGLSTVNDEGELVTTKFASQGSTSDCIDLLKKHVPARHIGDKVGIAHTRWATHGGKTDQNAHPHSDMKALLGVIPLQLLAYEISVARGINPDKPKI